MAIGDGGVGVGRESVIAVINIGIAFRSRCCSCAFAAAVADFVVDVVGGACDAIVSCGDFFLGESSY